MKFWPVLIICVVISGCGQKKMDTRISYDNSSRIALQENADKGDAESQFQLGNSYCCGDGGFYDTAQAAEWWCKAAAQGHAGAKDKLAEKQAACPLPATITN
jgi:TPR repeat protein